MSNKRIYYATQAVRLNPTDANGSGSTWYTPQGIQSVGMTTNFALTQLFQLGQQELYDNIDGVPEIEVTMQKTIDGTLPLYLLCMGGKSSGHGSGEQISALSTNRVNFQLGVYDDTVNKTSGTGTYHVHCSGMYLSSIGYTFALDGFSTEDVTLVGNSKLWGSGSPFTTNAFDNTLTAPGAVRRVNINIPSCTLPTGTAGIRLVGGTDLPYIQSISVKANLGRESINQLGKMGPYCRYVKFPLEVTSEFATMATDGDQVDGNDFDSVTGCGNNYSNLVDKPIEIVVCGTTAGDLMTIDLGPKNKLTSVNYTGGGVDGANATTTYSFQTFNYLKVSVTGSFSSVTGTK